MRADLALPDPVLDRLGKLAHQAQPSADPAAAAIKAPGQFLQGQPEAPMQLLDQPALLQRRLDRSRPHQPIHDQGVRLTELPQESPHGVLAQPAQGPHTLVAVDDHVAVAIPGLDHDDRDLLADLGK